MADLGTDIGGVLDVDNNLTCVSGRRALAECIGCLITTPKGGFFWDPDRGVDIREFLNGAAPGSQIESAIVREAVQDERVQSATASVTFIPQTQSLEVGLNLVDDDGPFVLVLLVSQLTVEILRLET